MPHLEKENKNPFWAKASKWINTGLLLTIGIMVWNATVALKTLTFDTPKDKIDTKNLVDKLNQEDIIVKIVEHVKDPEIHMDMSVKDSLFVTEEEYILFTKEVMKELNSMNVQIYVQGKLLKKIDDKL